MGSEHSVYNIVIGVLGGLNLIAGLLMIAICYMVCFKNRTCTRVSKQQERCDTTNNCSPKESLLINSEDKHTLEVTGVFQLLEVIDNRDKAKIWKATYEGLPVCVKSTLLHDMWANEASIYSLSSTANEFILQCTGSQQRGIHFYILCEYHPLGSLHNYLQHNTVTTSQALQIMYTVSSGLAHLHSNFFVGKEGSSEKKFAIAHRDVKSANVWVKNCDGHCVLGDLSQALVLNPRATKKSFISLNRKRKVGTMHYMSPEALEGRMNLLDTEAFKQIDIYALALVMWEVCNRVDNELEAINNYMIPFSDTVGENPTLEMMAKVVVTEKRRPILSEFWNENKKLTRIKKIMIESWDEDPEARLTAANIASQLQHILKETTVAFVTATSNESLATIVEVIENVQVQHSEIIVSISENSQNSDTAPHSLV